MGRAEQSPSAHTPEPTGLSQPAKKEIFVNLDSNSVHQINRYPILNKNQEQYLFRALKEGKSLKDVTADSDFIQTIPQKEEEKFWDTFIESDSVKEVITKCNLRLVASVARTYGVLPFQERFQEGYFGLEKAIDSFDPEKGKKFSTLATITIGQAIEKATYWQARPVRLPIQVEQAVTKARKVADEYIANHYEAPAREVWEKELSKDEKLTESQIKTAIDTIMSGTMTPASLDAPLGHEPNSGTLGDQMANTQIPASITNIFSNLQDSQLTEVLLDNLSLEEITILKLRFGLDNKRTQMRFEEIGKHLGKTENTIAQKQLRALKKLKEDPRLIDIYKLSQKNKPYQPTVKIETAAFLEASKDSGIFQTLNQEWQTIINKYFMTEATLENIANEFDQGSIKTLRKHFISKLNEIWDELPQSLQQKYPKDTVISLKTQKGRKHSPKTIAKMSATRKKQLESAEAQEQLRNLTQANRKKTVSKETREKLRLAHIGLKHTAETRTKMSQSHTGEKKSETARKNMAEAKRKDWAERKAREEKEKQKSQGDSFTQIFPKPDSA